MIDRVLLLSLGGCAVFGTLLFFELTSADDNQPAVTSVPARVEAPLAPRSQVPPIDELVATSLGRPLFSPTRTPQEQATADRPAHQELPNLRLTGIVIEPRRHLAIFAVAGAKPLVRSEGETINEWRLDSIEPHQVSLSGPTGITRLEPKTDPNIIRPVPAAQPGAPAGQPGAPGRPPGPVVQASPPLSVGAQPQPPSAARFRPPGPAPGPVPSKQ
jgi:general secretion pathway protein N